MGSTPEHRTENFRIKCATRLVCGQDVTKLGRKHCIPYLNTKPKQHKTKFIYENSRTQDYVSCDNRSKRGLQATSHWLVNTKK
jgi:hypothetical protein